MEDFATEVHGNLDDVRDRVQRITATVAGDSSAVYHITTVEGQDLEATLRANEGFTVAYPDGSTQRFDSLNSALLHSSPGYSAQFMSALAFKLGCIDPEDRVIAGGSPNDDSSNIFGSCTPLCRDLHGGRPCPQSG
eukprot:GGOE01057262.1.p1 GENE.GGOE01057262.1~~GGOE01057262.1.p1  ORF type:complete len:136 (-),score=23.36 GGOE01057262.1:252-659(-)